MGRPDYKRCRGCGRPTSEVGELSHTRQCPDCGADRLVENVVGLVTHSGPAFKRWRAGMAACIGLRLLDETPREGQTQAP